MTTPPTVAVIRSLSYTGTTWVNLVLGSHPRALALGPPEVLWEPAIDPRKLCAVHGRRCSFWPSVGRHLPASGRFSAIAHAAGRDCLVINNPLLASAADLAADDVDLRYIYVVRDGRAVLRSLLAHSGDRFRDSLDACRAWVSVFTSALIEEFQSQDHAMIVRYEDVVANTAVHLAEIGAFLGLDYGPHAHRFWEYEHHPIGGNGGTVALLRALQRQGVAEHELGERYGAMLRLARAEPDTRLVDETWQQELATDDRIAFDTVMGTLNARLGYERDGFRTDEVARALRRWPDLFPVPETWDASAAATSPDGPDASDAATSDPDDPGPLVELGPPSAVVGSVVALRRAFDPDLPSALTLHRLLERPPSAEPAVEPPASRRERALLSAWRRPSAAPAGARAERRPAEVRPLPVPFRRYLTIANDCDHPGEGAWRHVGEGFRDRFGLPVRDSVFVNWLVDRGMTAAGFDRDRFIDANGFALRRFHRGWFDVIHGWLWYSTGRVPVFDEVDPTEHRSPVVTLAPAALGGPVVRRLRFATPDEWLDGFPVRFLHARLEMPVHGTRFRMRGFVDGDRRFDVGSDDVLPRSFPPIGIDVVIDLAELADMPAGIDGEIEIEIALDGDGPIRLEHLALLSHSREQVQAYQQVIREFGLDVSVFTWHGIGLNLGSGRWQELAASNPILLADWRDGPLYSKDVLDEAGVEFFNTYLNYYETRTRRIDDLLEIGIFNDGSFGYDFHRYMDPDAVEPVERGIANPVRSDHLGAQLDAALDSSADEWTGAVVYTHASFRCDAAMADEAAATGSAVDHLPSITAPVERGLRRVADRFYGIDVEPGIPRCWVAPTSSLVRLAQVLRTIAGHAWYDPATDTIAIETWADPVTGYPVPNPTKGVADLRWLTLYVADADTATVTLDGVPITHLIRNGPDHTGRTSVTIADVRTPTPLLDPALPDVERRVVATRGSVKASAATGIRLKPGRSLRAGTRPMSASFAVSARPMVTDHQALRLRYESDVREPASLTVRVCLTDGTRWVLSSDRSLVGSTAIPVPVTGEPVDVVVPFWALVEAMPAASRRIPAGAVEAVEVVTARPIVIAGIDLLRDDDTPASDDLGLLVGGRVHAPLVAHRVRMELDGVRHETQPTVAGYYVFEQRVPPGAIVHVDAITASARVLEPVRGPFHHAVRHDLDLDFSGPPDDPAAVAPAGHSLRSGMPDDELVDLLADAAAAIRRSPDYVAYATGDQAAAPADGSFIESRSTSFAVHIDSYLASYETPDAVAAMRAFVRVVLGPVLGLGGRGGDLGCHCGLMSALMVAEGADSVLGLDHHAPYVRIARTWSSDYPALRYVANSAAEPSGELDWLLMNQVWCNAVDGTLGATLALARDLLRPGGCLIVSDTNNPHCPVAADRLRDTFVRCENTEPAQGEIGTLYADRRAYVAERAPGLDAAMVDAVAVGTCYLWGAELDRAIDGAIASGAMPTSTFEPGSLRSPVHARSGIAAANITDPYAIAAQLDGLGFDSHICVMPGLDFPPEQVAEQLSTSQGFYVYATRRSEGDTE